MGTFGPAMHIWLQPPCLPRGNPASEGLTEQQGCG